MKDGAGDMSLFDLTATLIDGTELKMTELAGKPAVMMNVASR